MSSPEHFRIDCLIPPFAARVINDLQFLPAFDNPLKPMTPTGLHHVGPLHQHQLALYEGLGEHFPITRLGVDEVAAYEAHEKLKADRAAGYLPKKAAPAPKVPAAPAPAAPAPAAVTFTPGTDSQDGAVGADQGEGDKAPQEQTPDGTAADAPKATGKKAAAKDAK